MKLKNKLILLSLRDFNYIVGYILIHFTLKIMRRKIRTVYSLLGEPVPLQRHHPL